VVDVDVEVVDGDVVVVSPPPPPPGRHTGGIPTHSAAVVDVVDPPAVVDVVLDGVVAAGKPATCTPPVKVET
jgi:hypothetical protein